MPNPLDYLKQAYSTATTPVVPKRFTDAIGNAIDSPSLDRSPMEARLRGFGAGALEGAREQLTPMNIIASLVPGYRAVRGAWGAGEGMQAAGALESAAKPAIDLIEHAPPRQVMPGMDDVDSLVGDMTRNLAKIRPRASAPMMTASPELAAVGDEGAYNAARQSAQPAGEYGEAFYQELMRKLGGRGPRH